LPRQGQGDVVFYGNRHGADAAEGAGDFEEDRRRGLREQAAIRDARKVMDDLNETQSAQESLFFFSSAALSLCSAVFSLTSLHATKTITPKRRIAVRNATNIFHTF